jgi:hypothetical protein
MTVLLNIFSSNGTIELANPERPYLDVEAGGGMEPGDPSFTEKIFSHSLLKQGGTLALESMKLKEQVFPLKLHARNKAALAEIIQEINLVINTPGAQVEWRDEGAEHATYFDLVSGQLDDAYDFRLGSNNWLKCKLRLFSQPLGYWSQKGARAVMVAGVATTIKIGTSPIITFRASGALRGDAPALMQVQVYNELLTNNQFYAALAVLPSSEYTPFISAASLSVVASFVGDSFAPGGTRAHWANWVGPAAQWTAPSLSRFAYVGEQRILVAARTPSNAIPTPIELGGPRPFPYTGLVATPVATSAWMLYDLGVISTASAMLANGEGYRLGLNMPVSVGASAAIDIGGFIQLPEHGSTWLNALPVPSLRPGHTISFDGVANGIRIGGNMGVPASGIPPTLDPEHQELTEMGGYARGAIPQIPAQIGEPVVAVLVAPMPDMNEEVEVNINVLERTRFIM